MHNNYSAISKQLTNKEEKFSYSTIWREEEGHQIINEKKGRHANLFYAPKLYAYFLFKLKETVNKIKEKNKA